MNEEPKPVQSNGLPENRETKKAPVTFRRVRNSLVVTLGGFFVFLVGARPSLFGLDRSPVVGFIQIAVMIIGIAIMCLGGYITFHRLWNGDEVSIAADIGMRFVASGFVFALFSGMADVFGIGSHPLPGVPYFGVWQARGMEISMALIAVGFIMMIPPKRRSEPNPGKQHT
jgi:hypothetical protein